ncbi:hypothetical protein DWB85_01150 [Seongchinamella sediminis]|uniref:Uncharacterized protein n=1 Tax=Seongchinamella sediminis TaxID=2283635 RepID=A0A3L7E3Q1_9GAMM|nr:hypothetical protein [Seongchinamella sediminis]RLQ23789.1 hypothetical protein DWB85_01150 [Seongchinamella sediminis]
MSEFQMTHVALVGARIEAFTALGFRSRSDLSMRRALPPAAAVEFQHMDQRELKTLLASQLPLWVHNCITDPGFPARDRLLMHLRRFEGELRDNRENEVIAAVLSAGFRNRQLDPLALPQSMPLRQRCSMLMHIETWQLAYRSLETAMVAILASEAEQLDAWLATAEPHIEHTVAI